MYKVKATDTGAFGSLDSPAAFEGSVLLAGVFPGGRFGRKLTPPQAFGVGRAIVKVAESGESTKTGEFTVCVAGHDVVVQGEGFELILPNDDVEALEFAEALGRASSAAANYITERVFRDAEKRKKALQAAKAALS